MRFMKLEHPVTDMLKWHINIGNHLVAVGYRLNVTVRDDRWMGVHQPNPEFTFDPVDSPQEVCQIVIPMQINAQRGRILC